MGREMTPNIADGDRLAAFAPVNRPEAFEQLNAELTLAFAALDSDYEPLDADTIIRRNVR